MICSATLIGPLIGTPGHWPVSSNGSGSCTPHPAMKIVVPTGSSSTLANRIGIGPMCVTGSDSTASSIHICSRSATTRFSQ